MQRRTLFAGIAATMAARPALAQGWAPDRPIRLVVPFAPGGSTDVTARMVAEAIALYLGLGAEWENFRGWHILLYIEGYGSCHYSVIVLAGYGSVAVVLLIVEVVGTLVYGGWLSFHVALVSDDSCHRLDYRYLGVLVGVESPFQFLGLLLLQLAVGGVVEVFVERQEDREEQF